MSKDCQDCEYFSGFDSDGCSSCDYPNGFEDCPFNAELRSVENATKITIDTEALTEYIGRTISNTVVRETHKIAEEKIKEIVNETCAEEIERLTKKSISEIIDKQVSDFMRGDITVGEGWSGNRRTISREQYMSEIIEACMKKQFDGGEIPKKIREDVERKIYRFTDNMRDRVNRQIRDMFTEATTKALTSNIVKLLMDNDTYRKMSDSMKHLLPENK